MHRYLQYTIFFIILILLQVFLFDNLGFGVYVHPLVYIGFILLLPMETGAFSVLMLGLLTGVTTDFLTGEAGLHTIATLTSAFLRPIVLTLVAGRDVVKEGGIPVPGRLGMGKWIRYSLMLVLIHCLIYFCFESLSLRYLHLTLLKVSINTVFTVVLIYFTQLLLPASATKK